MCLFSISTAMVQQSFPPLSSRLHIFDLMSLKQSVFIASFPPETFISWCYVHNLYFYLIKILSIEKTCLL